MLGALFLFFGLVPFLIGVYAWHLVRRRGEDGPDEPPPPPDPQSPLPTVPPAPRRRDRAPLRPHRVRVRWTPTRRVR
jgi:hypothetical protein